MKNRKEFISECREKRMTFREIGKILGICHQRVQQIYTGKRSKTKPIPVEDLKIWTARKRESLGLPVIMKNKGSGGLSFIRELVRSRDNYTCQLCGLRWEKGKRSFDVHHLDIEREGKHDIKYDRENMDKLITYCHKCHLNLHTVKEKLKKASKSYQQRKALLKLQTLS